MSLYGVYHVYDVDGGFGDSIGQQDLITIFETEDEAKEYVERWTDPYTYEIPYAELTCGELRYKKLPAIQKDLNIRPEEVGTMYYYKRDHSNSLDEEDEAKE